MDQTSQIGVDLTQRLANDVAIATGGAQGIGRALVARLAAEGANWVAILDVNAARRAGGCRGAVAGRKEGLDRACLGDVTSREQVHRSRRHRGGAVRPPGRCWSTTPASSGGRTLLEVTDKRLGRGASA